MEICVVADSGEIDWQVAGDLGLDGRHYAARSQLNHSLMQESHRRKDL